MRLLLTAVVPLFFAVPASAQEVSVPSVTTANPGGFANPLKLDTDRYKRANGDRQPRTAAPFGTCNRQPLIESRRAELEAGYLARAREGAMHGWRWLRDQCGATAAQSIERSAKRSAVAR